MSDVKIDLNADLGEGYGPWKMGDDSKLLDVVTSANIACGLHAGDPYILYKTVGLALEKGIKIGAHPGFDDLKDFGRKRMDLSPDDLRAILGYQIGAVQGTCALWGASMHHVKLHGALSNMAAEDEDLATRAFEAIAQIAPGACVYIQPYSAMEPAAQKVGLPVMSEVFADRTYRANGLLTPRSQEGSVLLDPQSVSDHVNTILRERAIPTIEGNLLRCPIDTICIHGDNPYAVEAAKKVKSNLF